MAYALWRRLTFRGASADERCRITRNTPRSKGLEHTYETPAIVDTFDALEVMGAAEGSTCGTGSQILISCVPS